MKKNEWIALAQAMWQYSERDTELGPLLKELIYKINNNLEVIVDDNDNVLTPNGSNGKENAETGGIFSFQRSK